MPKRIYDPARIIDFLSSVFHAMAFTIIQSEHRKVHEGEAFVYSEVFRSVQIGGTESVLVKATTSEVHLTINFETATKTYWNTYGSDTTFTDEGIIQPYFNRIVGGPSGTAEVYIQSIVNVYGNARGERVIPVGQTGGSSGGTSGTRLESVIKPGDHLYIEFENAGTNNRDMGIILDWYEVERG